MENPDHDPQPMFDDLVPARPDPRRVVACFVVCALAATAVFLVARSTGSDHERVQTAAPSTTAAPQKPTPPTEADDDSDTDNDDTFLCRMLAHQVEGTGLCGTTRERPSSRPETATPEPEGSDAMTASPAGWTRTSETVNGWQLSVAHPEDWVTVDDFDGAAVRAEDQLTAVTTTGGRWSGHPQKEMAQDYVNYVRATLAPDLEVLDKGPARLAGLDGYRVRYRGTREDLAFEGDATWLIDGEMMWFVVQVHEPGDEDAASLTTQVAESFRVTPPA